MYKLMTLAAVLVALALAPVFGGASEGDTAEQVDAVEQANRPNVAEQAQIDEAQRCEWSCQACEPELGCQQICTEIGDCGSTCGVTARCDAHHAWSDEACACVPR